MEQTKTKLRVLVCGGRDFGRVPMDAPANDMLGAIIKARKEQALISHVLMLLKQENEIEVVIEGGSRGADEIAGEWADANHLPHLTYPADWDTHKKAAGAIRNQQMLDEGKPTLVVAFPGGAGTADMVKRATKAGVEVRKVDYVG